MENPTEDQAVEESALALQQSGHKGSTLSLTSQMALRPRDSLKIKPKSL